MKTNKLLFDVVVRCPHCKYYNEWGQINFGDIKDVVGVTECDGCDKKFEAKL